jgi:Rrf2 family protein
MKSRPCCPLWRNVPRLNPEAITSLAGKEGRTDRRPAPESRRPAACMFPFPLPRPQADVPANGSGKIHKDEALMRFSRASLYALHALVFMGRQKDNHPVASHVIAHAEGIPERFLLKVLKPLVSAGVLQSIKGPNGGYRLTRPVRTISLLEVVEAVDGSIRGQVSFEGKNSAGLERRLETIFDDAAGQVRRQYKKVRISDLTGKA